MTKKMEPIRNIQIDKFLLRTLNISWAAIGYKGIEVVLIDGGEGEHSWKEEDGTWWKHRRAGATGGPVLVLPDGFVLYLFRVDALTRGLDVVYKLTELMKNALRFKDRCDLD